MSEFHLLTAGASALASLLAPEDDGAPLCGLADTVPPELEAEFFPDTVRPCRTSMASSSERLASEMFRKSNTCLCRSEGEADDGTSEGEEPLRGLGPEEGGPEGDARGEPPLVE